MGLLGGHFLAGQSKHLEYLAAKIEVFLVNSKKKYRNIKSRLKVTNLNEQKNNIFYD